MAGVSFPWAPRGDVIAFETPELTRVEYRLAPFGARIVSALLDRLVILGVTLVLLFIALLVLTALGTLVGEQVALLLFGAFMAVNFLLSTLVLAWSESRSGGQTWGKRRMGLRTLLLSGQPPGVAAALVRNLAHIVDDWPPLWVVPTLGPARQRFGDLLAGTCVVVDRPPKGLLDPVVWPAESWRALTERRFELPPEVSRRLVKDDLDLVEHVLRRVQSEPDLRRRDELLRPVVARYLRRLDLGPMRQPALANPRRFLGEVGLMLRDREAGPGSSPGLAPAGARAP
jgi:uncharacterized RDD family membrane protein YckC